MNLRNLPVNIAVVQIMGTSSSWSGEEVEVVPGASSTECGGPPEEDIRTVVDIACALLDGGSASYEEVMEQVLGPHLGPVSFLRTHEGRMLPLSRLCGQGHSTWMVWLLTGMGNAHLSDEQMRRLGQLLVRVYGQQQHQQPGDQRPPPPMVRWIERLHRNDQGLQCQWLCRLLRIPNRESYLPGKSGAPVCMGGRGRRGGDSR